MPKVLVADLLSNVGIEVLKDGGLQADILTGRSEEELCEVIGSYDALIVRSATKVTARVIEAGNALKAIGRAGVGVDNVDVEAATRKGIVVMNTPLGNVTSAAEHAVALLLALARNVPAADSSMKAGRWEKKKFIGVELRDKLLGIVGMGKVAQIVTRAGIGLGMKVIAYDPFLPDRRAAELGVEMHSLDDLLSRADFISVHAPLTEKTRGLLGERALAKMKPSARLINCARGGIVDEEHLTRALREGRLAGAAMDVFEQEPLPPDSPLRNAPNIILTPHLGASTEEAQLKVAETIARQMVAFFKENKIHNAVNLAVTLVPELEAFAALAENLGRLLSQLLSKPPQRLTCSVQGRIAGGDIRALTVFGLQGLLANWHDQSVNLINAALVAEERGIQVTEQKSLHSTDYANSVRLVVNTADSEHEAAGTVFEGREQRIVEIDGFNVDLKPEGTLLVMFYPDRPGMVGRFGTILGDAGINIAGMDVGRKEKRGRACVALSVDDPVPPEVLEQIRACTGSGEAYLVNL